MIAITKQKLCFFLDLRKNKPLNSKTKANFFFHLPVVMLFSEYMCENKNFDICVTDSHTNAVVVVNQSREFQFRYTAPRRSCQPFRFPADSQSRILTSDRIKNLIHILNQHGQFLCYLNNAYCYLQFPWRLCVDNNDILFVAESAKGKVRKIQYCSK